ncbi:MAG: prolyl oligopeptidase family serine peptidase [Anaerolineae bacterium]|nr:prolyl oligopeptidase family serine peptidase [Anaerolineae bacterium]
MPATPTQTAVPVSVGQHAYSFAGQTGRLNYLLFLPRSYDPGSETMWPLILFLHGSGEKGSSLADLEMLKRYGPPMLVEQQSNFPFVVLSPQCASESWESRLETLLELLDTIAASYAVDPQRIYLTGLSMGGFGTWQLALRAPDRFAALAPIAGGYRYRVEANYEGYGQSGVRIIFDTSMPDHLCDLASVPVWALHGDRDTTVPHEQTADVIVEALRACGNESVQYTLYPDTGHDAWTRTYSDPDLYTWLLEQKKDGL